MHEALSFGLGLVLGAVIIGGIWLTERRIRRHRDDKELQSAKLAMHEQVRLILDTLPQSYIVVDRNHRVVRSSALATAFGLVHGQLLRPELDAIVGDIFASGQTRDTEFDMANRRSRHAVARRIWVRVARASADKVVVLFEDQTEKIRLENTRRDFVANVSHELKTPIGGIKLLAETISNVSDDVEQVRRFAQALETESDRLSQLVQEIIQLSRLQESDALTDPQIVSIDAVVVEALKRTQLEADARQIDLVSGGEPGLTVVGDFLLLVTAVRNLLDNAVRYSNPHSRVSVVVSGTNTEVHIAVIDAGVGISDEAKTRVFERFYRGDEARSRETGGTGLGLSIVKHVVNDHGGQVKLWSELGHGSTFTLVLPRADVSAAGMAIPGGENR